MAVDRNVAASAQVLALSASASAARSTRSPEPLASPSSDGLWRQRPLAGGYGPPSA
ncbi:MAG: hypothetical protein AAFQ43_03330 [Bacteroidota bacterium]